MAGSDSKTEKATPKKRKDERKKGNVFKSNDIVSVASLLVLFSVTKIMFPSIYGRMTIFMEHYMNYAVQADSISQNFTKQILIDVAIEVAYMIGPILLLGIFIAIVATGAQTKFLFSMEGLQPKFNRLNPLEGLKKIVSLKSFIEVLKGSIKIVIIGAVIYNFFQGRINTFSQAFFVGINQAVIYLLQSVMTLVYSICLIFIFVAGLDYLYQRWDYERQIKMSKHDVKEEYKQMEGDPQIKGKIKAKQREFAMSRMMQAVPTADVVIKNPTHFAVALKYDLERDNAPMIVAKGQDHVAFKIIKVAEYNGVEVVENRELARAIFAASEIGMEIPMDYYAAVAEILAVIYKMRNRRD